MANEKTECCPKCPYCRNAINLQVRFASTASASCDHCRRLWPLTHFEYELAICITALTAERDALAAKLERAEADYGKLSASISLKAAQAHHDGWWFVEDHDARTLLRGPYDSASTASAVRAEMEIQDRFLGMTLWVVPGDSAIGAAAIIKAMSKSLAYHYYPYAGYILVKQDHAIGIGIKKYGGRDYVDHWLPLPNIGHIVYATGVKSADLFVNQLMREIEIPEWLAKEKGII